MHACMGLCVHAWDYSAKHNFSVFAHVVFHTHGCTQSRARPYASHMRTHITGDGATGPAGLLDVIADASSHDPPEGQASVDMYKENEDASEGWGVRGWDVYYYSEMEGRDFVPPLDHWKLGRWGGIFF